MLTRRHIFSGILTAIFAQGVSVNANENSSEANVRAAILYNLARFTAWPEDTQNQANLSNNEFRVCTLSGEEMRSAIKALEGKHIHGKKLKVTHLSDIASITSKCHVAFIDNESEKDCESLYAIADLGVLTIGTSSEFLRRGGGMSIERQRNRLRFSINLNVMSQADLRPSSKILNLAVRTE